LLRTTDKIVCDNREIRYADLYKFAWAGSGSRPDAAKRNYIWYKTASNEDPGMRFRQCQADDLTGVPPLQIRNADTNKLESIELADIVDFVARSKDANSPINPGVPLALASHP
jgi:hypothetical protein